MLSLQQLTQLDSLVPYLNQKSHEQTHKLTAHMDRQTISRGRSKQSLLLHLPARTYRRRSGCRNRRMAEGDQKSDGLGGRRGGGGEVGEERLVGGGAGGVGGGGRVRVVVGVEGAVHGAAAGLEAGLAGHLDGDPAQHHRRDGDHRRHHRPHPSLLPPGRRRFVGSRIGTRRIWRCVSVCGGSPTELECTGSQLKREQKGPLMWAWPGSHLWASGRPGSVAPTRIALSLFSVFVKSNESKIKKIKRIEVQSSPAKKEKNESKFQKRRNS